MDIKLTEKRESTYKDVSYRSHERHALDFWKAGTAINEPLVVFIHGGGFGAKSKEKLSFESLEKVVSMYLAFHDEIANPESSDPVEMESTRLLSVATTVGQTTLDTGWWLENVPS